MRQPLLLGGVSWIAETMRMGMKEGVVEVGVVKAEEGMLTASTLLRALLVWAHLGQQMGMEKEGRGWMKGLLLALVSAVIGVQHPV